MWAQKSKNLFTSYPLEDENIALFGRRLGNKIRITDRVQEHSYMV